MNVALYIHVPFCLRRCTYCDFNSYANILNLRPVYVEALKQEIRLKSERYRNVQGATLYFGGGTPSLLLPEDISGIIQAIRHGFGLSDLAEITMEINPGTVNKGLLTTVQRAGVNRLSFGVQSAHSEELHLLGRVHTWQQAASAVALAESVGFRNISVDLIFGIPKQTLVQWQQTLQKALALEPQHVSLYALTLEPGTPLAEAVALGTLPSPDPDLAAEMYEAASTYLQKAGFWQYEISNWARGHSPSPACWALPPGGHTEAVGPWISQHNLVYWRNQPWLGFGAGAHSWFRHRRWRNLPHPSRYVQAVHARQLKGIDGEIISSALEQGETMMMGLRLAEGVTETRFQKRFGVSLGEIYQQPLKQLSEIGLLAWDGDCARLSPHGRLLGNQVFSAFLPE